MEIIMLTAVAHFPRQLQRGCVVDVGGKKKPDNPHVGSAQAERWLASGYAEKYTGQTLPPLKQKEMGLDELKSQLSRLKSRADDEVRNAIGRAEQAEADRDDLKDKLEHAEFEIAGLKAQLQEAGTPQGKPDDTTQVRTTPKKNRRTTKRK